MKKNIIQTLLLFGTIVLTAACSSESENVLTPTITEVPTVTETEEVVVTPITITANYGNEESMRVSYAEDGKKINPLWEKGDKICVVFDGKVNELELTEGDGTSEGTFEGTIEGTPKSGDKFICFVIDKNYPVTVDGGGTFNYATSPFVVQDGTLAGATQCNLYVATDVTYDEGTNITCDFAPSTAILKLDVWPLSTVAVDDEATLTYKSGEEVIAVASFKVTATDKATTYYLAVPGETLEGEQTLTYKSGSNEKSITLSATKAAFTAGKTYKKEVSFLDTSKEFVINTTTKTKPWFGSGDYYEAVQDDFNNETTPNPTLKLNVDLNTGWGTGNDDIIITRKDGVFDLNGHKLYQIYVKNDVLGSAVTVKNGTITHDFEGGGTTESLARFYGTVILENMTVEQTLYSDGHALVIKGGTYNTVINETDSGKGYPGTVTIYDGYFSVLSASKVDGVETGTFILKGGKYKQSDLLEIMIKGTERHLCVLADGYSFKANTDSDSAEYPYIVTKD